MSNQSTALIYLDYNATTPLAEEVIESIKHSLKVWGNPSSKNPEGIKARHLIDESRRNVASCISAKPSDIIFTSGGSESNNWVIYSSLKSFNSKNPDRNLPHIITSDVEHDSIIGPLTELEQNGKIRITLLRIDPKTGELDVKNLASKINTNTCLITIMWANNETGTIMPIKEIARVVRRKEEELGSRIFLHTDAAQVIGKLNVDVTDVPIDFLTMAGHKFYGPKIGALFVKNLQESREFYPMIYGGGQESGWRAGTENVPMIVGLGRACSLVTENLQQFADNMKKTRNYLEEKLQERFGENNLHFNCKSTHRLPNTCNVSITMDGCKGYKILEKAEKFCCSTGSACHSNTCEKPSKILLKFGIEAKCAMNALRLSTGRNTSCEDVDVVVDELERVVKLLSVEHIII